MNIRPGESIYQAIVFLIAALLCCFGAVTYFRRVRMQRPPVGVFNGLDIAVLFVFVLVIPFVYLLLPQIVSTLMLLLTFTGALYIVLRPLMPLRFFWGIALLLVSVNIVATEFFIGTRLGWQIHWLTNSILVLLTCIGVSNLYIQGGMRLRHVAWFALALAVYDFIFSLVIPVNLLLAEHLQAQPLNPSFGFPLGTYLANIGLGDLLMVSLFTTAAYKGFGRRGMVVALIISLIFGALLPGLTPIIVAATIGGNVQAIPVQSIFGPVAFLGFLWLVRLAPERSMAEWVHAERRTL